MPSRLASRLAGRLAAPAATLLALALAGGAGAQGALETGATRIEERARAAGGAARERLEALPGIGPVAERLHVSGSWLGTFWETGSASQVGNRERDSDTWDARVFVDADLASDVRFRDATLANAVGISFEWEFYRLGRRIDEVAELYLDVQGLGGSSWWNVQIGRFQIPVGENYLRFGRAYRDNPFLTNPVAGAWWWDEGVKLHGRGASGRFGYVASVSSGETARNWDVDGGGQATLKLFTEPKSWLHLSASALWSGSEGSRDEPGESALWLGETWARSFGAYAGIPNLDHGRVVPDADGRIDRTLYFGADAVLTHPRGARLWLSYGNYEIASASGGLYDRRLHGWIAELVVEGRAVSPTLRRFYVALRANGLGTWDRDEGYLLDVRYTGRYGYDMESLSAYSLAVGWRVLAWATLKLEYTYQDVDLVRGAGSLGLRRGNANHFGAALGLHF